MRNLVCHLAHASSDAAYFRAIAGRHDTALSVMLGSLAPAGPLQEAMRQLGTLTFTLGASRRSQYLLATLRLVRLLRRERVAILHAHGFDPTWLGLIAARLAGIAFVFSRHHSNHHIRMGKRWHTRVDGWCARHADHVIAVSEATRRIMVEIEGTSPKKISMVYNGVDQVEEPAPEEVCKLRGELRVTEMDRVCLVIGRLHEEKGHRFLFGALPEVQRQVGPVKTFLAGAGPHRRALEAEVEANGLGDSVCFLGHRDDVAALMSLASVVVLPSLAESFGQVLTEAMSLGKPVVATATGGVPEVVLDGETGLLVPPGDAAGLARAICRILDDRVLARSMGEAGRRRAKTFSYESMLRNYEAVYRRVLTGASSDDRFEGDAWKRIS